LKRLISPVLFLGTVVISSPWSSMIRRLVLPSANTITIRTVVIQVRDAEGGDPTPITIPEVTVVGDPAAARESGGIDGGESGGIDGGESGGVNGGESGGGGGSGFEPDEDDPFFGQDVKLRSD
jgi:uncharacterized membrane protein YgcG